MSKWTRAGRAALRLAERAVDVDALLAGEAPNEIVLTRLIDGRYAGVRLSREVAEHERDAVDRALRALLGATTRAHSWYGEVITAISPTGEVVAWAHGADGRGRS